MDDTDLVRPPRHTRKPTSRRAPARRATRGQASKDGPKDVCVKGRLTCGCGAAIAVNVKGQPGSIAVQAAEMTLAMKKPMCAKCVEREDEERERAEAEALATAKHARRDAVGRGRPREDGDGGGGGGAARADLACSVAVGRGAAAGSADAVPRAGVRAGDARAEGRAEHGARAR